jgi:pimeloyl-ACP methyl ester carboxylesterase
MPIARVRGLNLRYEIVGDDGPMAVLITGGRRGYAEFGSLASQIAAGGYRVLLHDRRNTGASDISFDGDEVEEAVWADDLFELLSQLGSIPAFIGGASSGARTALNFCIRHPEATRALLLLRVTGGEYAARRLTESYYAQFIRIAQEGGLEAICATEQYQERFKENPANLDKLMAMDVDEYIDVMSTWMSLFEAVAHFPVMGVSEERLRAINVPTMISPGNDLTHSSTSAYAAHQHIKGSELHQLPVSDQSVPLIPFTEWGHLEREIAEIFTEFMRRS